MSTAFNGSKPGLPTRNVSFYRSISLPQRAHLERSSTSSFESSSEKAWSADELEKADNVSTRDLAVEGEQQPCPVQVAQSIRPSLKKEESYWQAGPPASIYSTGDDTAYPEGGLRAWLVVLGAFCGMMAAFGFMNTSKSLT